jgi:tetratricopeptide (TPR) repeat protein
LIAARFEIPDELLTRLREDVILRRIGTSIQWFEEHREPLLFLDPDQKNAAAFVGYFSQWVDIGYGDAAIVGELLRRFPKEKRAALPLCDYIHLELAEGMVASAEEETEKAIARFDLIITLGDEAVADKQLLSLAHFWKGRCKRKQGEYDSALAHCRKGRELAVELGYTRMAAVMQVLESWLCFQKEKLPEAAAILEEAEAVLSETDDSVTIGNIQSGYGRIALREARYDQALEHFARAIGSYRKRDPRHRNLARCLANMAYVKRLTAIRLAQRIDDDAKHRRKTAAATAPSRQRVEQLREEVLSNLAQAEEIYRSVHHHRGWGTVHIERGLLFLDIGDVERAGGEAGEAYQLGAEKKDNILMARARIVQSIIESAKHEEGLDEDPTVHAQRALDYARDALTFAKRTENRHLLARANIFQGMVLCNDFFNNLEAGRECCDRAEEFLTPGIHDHLWEEHQALKAKVLSGGNVDVLLRKWSQGATDDQTFQQLTERFAEIIIPKVWEREGRKVSRVALKLSVSPKKVRRILGRLGLKGE